MRQTMCRCTSSCCLVVSVCCRPGAQTPHRVSSKGVASCGVDLQCRICVWARRLCVQLGCRKPHAHQQRPHQTCKHMDCSASGGYMRLEAIAQSSERQSPPAKYSAAATTLERGAVHTFCCKGRQVLCISAAMPSCPWPQNQLHSFGSKGK